MRAPQLCTNQWPLININDIMRLPGYILVVTDILVVCTVDTLHSNLYFLLSVALLKHLRNTNILTMASYVPISKQPNSQITKPRELTQQNHAMKKQG